MSNTRIAEELADDFIAAVAGTHCTFKSLKDMDVSREKLETIASKALQTALDTQRAEFEREIGWQPIETAPKDGTPILACSQGSWPDWHSAGLHPTTVRWRVYHPNRKGQECWRDQRSNPVYPTHWRPLPAAPEAIKSQGV